MVITTSCAVDEGSFADVDSDGVDDLVLRSGPHVFSWPSSREPGVPLLWSWNEPGEPGWLDISTPNLGPARIQWWSFQPDGAYEYEVDPDTLALDVVGSGEHWGGFHHVGDVDGDGAADSYSWYPDPGTPISVRASSTGLYTAIPGWGHSDDESWPYEYAPYYAWSVGDLNHDGYDDLLVGQRQSETADHSPDYGDIKAWGPAQLYLGSPTGIQAEPLWTLSAPGHPMAGVGRGVAALPDERAVVVTVVTEGHFYGDFSPELLGVIRDADTPDAYFDELVAVPEFTPGGFTPYLEGWMDDGTGQPALAMVEAFGSTGMQWIPWFADGSGFHPDDGVAVPSTWWAPPGYQVLDGSLSALAFPVGRHNQAIFLGLHTETGYQLVEWGRPLDQLGIPAEGVTAGGCTFTAWAWGDPRPSTEDTGPSGPSDGVPLGFGPDPSSEARACGCDTTSGTGWLAGVMALLGRVALRRRRAGWTLLRDLTADEPPGR